MMERGHKELGPWAMTNSSERTSKISIEQANILTYKLVRVEDDGSFVPASEDEVTEVEHLLAEPKNENGLMDSVLGGDAARTDRNLGIEGFQCPGNYGQINSDCGAFYSSIAREGKVESKYEFLDGTLHGVYGGDLHVADGISIACDDYLLDSEYSEKVPDNDYGLCGETHFENLGWDSNSPRLGEGDRGAVVIPNSFTPTISQLESSSDRNSVLLEKMTVCELQETFRSTFGRETSNKDKQWLKRRIMFGLQNLVELDSGSLFLESGRSSNGSEGNLIFTCSDDSAGRTDHSFTNHLGNTPKLTDHGLGRVRFSGRDATTTSYRGTGNVRHRPLITVDGESVHQSQKRLRKPTKRYIEESSNPKSRPCGARLEFLITNSGDKLTRPRSHKHNHRTGFGATPVVYRKDSFKGFGIQVPFGLQVPRGRPKKNTSILEHHSEDNDEYLGPSPAESQDDTSDDSFTRSTSEKVGSRRKHHRLWSLSEVVKLIDGVSQYGVGRWTEIKKLLFSTSAHRTSVDLKDKWRNLLRASGAQLPNKKYVEQQGRKHPATRPIPASLLRRVSELAVIYPYPRERTSKQVKGSRGLVAVTPATNPI